MPWVRLDDRFPSHRKVALLSDRAFRLYVSALCWASENLTEGKILDRELTVVARVRNAKAAARELEEANLWERLGDGWQIHDFLEYNPDRARVQADREANAARQKAWRERKKAEREAKKAAEEAARNAVTPPQPKPENSTTATRKRRDGDTNARESDLANHSSSQVNDFRNGVSNGAPAPAPSRITSPNGEAAAAGARDPLALDTLGDLKRAVAEAGITGVSWNFQASQIARTVKVIDHVGIGPMVAMAVGNVRLKGPPAGATAWIADWETLEPGAEGVATLPVAVGSPLRAVPDQPTSHNSGVIARARARRQQQS